MDSHSILQVLLSSAAATTVMTLCSYAVSAAAREIYKEPILLAYILKQLHLNISSDAKNMLGWVLHYVIGLAFVTAYHLLWSHKILDATILSSIMLGAASGMLGIIGWIVLFKIVHQKPNIDYKGYYAQLFAVHVIFGVTAFLVYRLFL
ncbi:hypothetical protein [Flavobacterium johnsoniae]|uniref:DUF2938 family protein n=1 Tax=Flavobacterium johnsoniae (strain ATCC 17061 / DSM 2064 / JCM 8514 / BCRC 14874 / CCUG 350202 / NBRC 14942 / NCIMB 11054 / UW101) TaxID=376686 RepID=A5FGJ4_FLAJ1|nr:hypothetical protein [Flavobacterium johnsoniae]ABQ05670.1 hypothetical protein Fjoh_2644 [Flavobacterium johnsoniae UW101]OXG00062.1 hypothetical protein B0A63_10150 [Flavobacterium johnsoniae UW101]WQG82523.1 hypothetical protein SR927_05270 [Flavobacterium johnsoniae UW101]SHL50312.1 hypothetical protein SAMN05444146_3819 [Flavobacterium johnsoniae]